MLSNRILRRRETSPRLERDCLSKLAFGPEKSSSVFRNAREGGRLTRQFVCLYEFGHRDVTKREACEFVEFSKIAPSPIANSTFSSWFSYFFKLQSVLCLQRKV